MINIVKNAVNAANDMNVWEIGLLKIYLVSATFLLSIWFPVLLEANLYFYLIIGLISLVYLLLIMFKKEGNFYKKILKKGFSTKVFKKLNIYELSLFKVIISLFALFIAKLFPVVLTADIGWYIAIAAIGAGYFSNMFFYEK